MIINGREPPEHFVQRAPLFPRNVCLANTTHVTIRIDGQLEKQIQLADVARTLSIMRHEDVTLTLSNAADNKVSEASEAYKVSFRIADTPTLQCVERAFLEYMTPSDISVGSIRSFLDDPRCAAAGSDYANALAEFTLGVLRKEDPDTVQMTTPVRMYREFYVLAEAALREIERPLARLVTQIARFALNDFSPESLDTGYWELDVAYRLLRDPRSPSPPKIPERPEKRRQICPIDHDTGRLLDLAARMSTQERWSPLLSNECRSVVFSGSLDVEDQNKAAAIWAVCAWRLAAVREASEPLRMIAATYPFDQWAAPLLKELTQ